MKKVWLTTLSTPVGSASDAHVVPSVKF